MHIVRRILVNIAKDVPLDIEYGLRRTIVKNLFASRLAGLPVTGVMSISKRSGNLKRTDL